MSAETGPEEEALFDSLSTEMADDQHERAVAYLVGWASDIRVQFVNHGWSTEGAEQAAQSMLQAQLDRHIMASAGYVIVEDDDEED